MPCLLCGALERGHLGEIQPILHPTFQGFSDIYCLTNSVIFVRHTYILNQWPKNGPVSCTFLKFVLPGCVQNSRSFLGLNHGTYNCIVSI